MGGTDANTTRWKCPRCLVVRESQLPSYRSTPPACPNLECRGTAMVPAPEWKEKPADEEA